MSRFEGREDFRHDERECLGVLVTNLGTPEAPTAGALRRYLGQFLADPRVVELPRPLWRLILHGIVLRTRPRESAKAYAKIWTGEGSPLLTGTRALAEGLQADLEQQLSGPVRVEMAMRYGRPDIPSALRRLRDAGARRLLLLPLYPQYASSTTGSTWEAVTGTLSGWRWIPEFRMVASYHEEATYISALADSIRRHWERHGRGERLMFSFHGIPRYTFLAGDPYHCQCHKTARLVAEALDLADDDWTVCFQSRFGRAEWLKPYTDKTLEAWGQAGMGDIDVICPGFAVDCLETLEEIALQNAELYRDAGGGKLRYVPALNAEADHQRLLSELVLRHAAGWPEVEGRTVDEADERARESQRRAQAMTEG